MSSRERAVAGAILFGITGNKIFTALILGCIATSTADTLASEIGVTGGTHPLPDHDASSRSRGNERWRYRALRTRLRSWRSDHLRTCARAGCRAPWYVCLIGISAGFFGTNMDCLIGALIKNKGVIGNSGTNLLATLSGGLFAMLVYGIAATAASVLL